MNEFKTWGMTETGSVFHSFKADGTALCRSNVKAGRMFHQDGGRTEDRTDAACQDNPHLFRKCASCAKKEAAHRARVEASMTPVNPYDQVCEGIETPEGARLAAGDECETVTDAEAMSQADDALAFAMTAGAPGTACPECERRTSHKLDCSTGRRTTAPVDATCNNCRWRMSSNGVCMNCRWDNGRTEHKTGQDIDPVVRARQMAAYNTVSPVRKLAEWLDAE